MTTLTAIYIFMAIATSIALLKDFNLSEVIASVIVGLVWPLFMAVKILQKLL